MRKTAGAAALAVLFAYDAVAQDAARTARQLFEAGDHAAAVQAVDARRDAGTVDPAETYLAVQSLIKLGQTDRARDELARLAESGDECWQLVARSASALLDGDTEQALAASTQASASPGGFFAQYQRGLVLAEREDWAGAAEAFDRAAQFDPTFAYAHYYAGLAYSKIRRIERTAEHFEAFLKLAPSAPERAGVESIMRTLRGRD
jgi:tetratricopeptide (TPR) repeat protein